MQKSGWLRSIALLGALALSRLRVAMTPAVDRERAPSDPSCGSRSPDPVIDWMNDQGIIPEYEEKWNVRS